MNVYEIVARAAKGPPKRGLIETDLFQIGSDDTCNLRLTGEGVRGTHVRLLPTARGQIIVINLAAAGDTLLDGQPVTPGRPTVWKPDKVLRLADYDLRIYPMFARAESSVPHDTAAEDEPPAKEDLPTVRPSGLVYELPPDRPSDMPPLQPVASGADDNLPTFKPGEAMFPTPPPSATPFIPEPVSPAAPAPLDEDADRTPVDREALTPIPTLPPDRLPGIAADAPTPLDSGRPPFPLAPGFTDPAPGGSQYTSYFGGDLPGEETVARTPGQYDTLVKDWHSVGQISAHLPGGEIAVTPGERARVSVSVRNENDYPVELQVFVTGIPENWVSLPEPAVRLDARQIRTVDVIFLLPAVYQPRINAAVRLQEGTMREASLSLPFSLVIKSAPNVTGWLEPVDFRVPAVTHLYLQNHTRSTARVFVTGGSASPVVHVSPLASDILLPPGETLGIPIEVRVSQRPRYAGYTCEYWVSAKEGSRAPLDYEGVVTVGARWPLAVLIPALLVIIACIATLSVGAFAVRELTAPTPTFTPSPTPLPTSTPPPTATPAPPPTLTPTPALVDPRPSSCNVAIPDGWLPYEVEAGDNLFRLALNRGTTIDDIVRVNCLGGPGFLVVGDTLLLPPE